MDEIFFAVRMTLPLPSSDPASARIMPSLETQDHAMEDVVMVKLSVVDKSGLLLDVAGVASGEVLVVKYLFNFKF